MYGRFSNFAGPISARPFTSGSVIVSTRLIINYAIAHADGTNMGDGAFSNMRLGALHVYNTALSAGQVSTNFQAGRSQYGV